MDGTLRPDELGVHDKLHPGTEALLPVEKQRSKRRADLDGWTLQERLSTLLSWDAGAKTLGQKLYSRFGGKCEKLPPLLELLEERWGFPQRLWPLLWGQLRRENQGPLKRIGGVQAPEFVTEGQWLAAFIRWLQSLQARLGQQKVSRKMMVRRHQTSDMGAEEQYFHGPLLGEGAYGEVYAMFHRSLGVKRAVKVIHKSRLSVSPVVAEDEVRVLKSLDHPHVIRIYEAFERHDTLHVVMDWAEGGTLASVLSTQRANDRKVTEAWACTAAQQMCAALEYIHFKGVVHCDLKPENAMLLRAVEPMRNEAPHLVLVDFGLAEIVEARQNGGPLMIRGTAVYLSPEGFEGHLTEKSDLWALGVVIFEMLLGRRPFQADNMAVLWLKVAQHEAPLDEMSESAAEVVQGLLNKDPIARLTAQECRTLAWFANPELQLEPPDLSSRRVKIDALGSANCFHQIAMFAVATGLSMKDMHGVFQVFQSIDKDKSGNLDFEEFSLALEKLNITEDPQRLMSILDMDQNGRISYTEFLAAVLSTSSETVPESLIQEAFDVFDVDGDGQISLSELRVMLSGEGPLVEVLPNGQTVDEVMQDIAGGKQSISFPDFQQYISQASAQRRKSRERTFTGQGTAGEQVIESMVEALEVSEEEPSEAPEENLQAFAEAEASVAPVASELPPSDEEDSEDRALWRAFGPSKERWAQQRPNSQGRSLTVLPREAFSGALPPVHDFLLKAFGGTFDNDDPVFQERRKALDCLLRFPEQSITLEQSDLLAAHISSLSQHFMAGMVLARLLADAEDATKSGTLHSKLKQAIQAMKIDKMDSPSPRARELESAAPSPAPPSDWMRSPTPRVRQDAPSPLPTRQLRSRPPQAKRPWGAPAPSGDESREVRLAELRKKTKAPKGLRKPRRQLIPVTATEVSPGDGGKYPFQWHVEEEIHKEIFVPELVMGPAKRAAYDPPPIGRFQRPEAPKLPRLASYKNKPRRVGPVLRLRTPRVV